MTVLLWKPLPRITLNLCLLSAILAAIPCRGEGPPAKLPTPSPLAEATQKFTRQDAELWQARTAELEKLLTESRKSADLATRELAEARQQLLKSDQEVAAAQKELQALLPPGIKAKPLSTSQADPAKPPVATAPKLEDVAVTRARERLQAALEQQTSARKQLTHEEQELKQACASRDARLKAHTEASMLQKQAGERLALLLQGPHSAKPENTRLIQTFSASRPVLIARWDREGRGFFAGLQGSDILRYDLYRGIPGGLATSQGEPGYLEMKGHHSWVASLAVAPKGEPTLVSASYNGHMIRWDLRQAVPILSQDRVAHQGFVRAVAYSPDGNLIATCGNDLVVRVWKPNGTLLSELRGHASHIYNVAFHPSGRFLVSGDLMGILKQWDTSNWRQIRELDAKVLEKYDEQFYAHCGGIRSLDFSPDGSQLVVSGVSDVTNAFAGVAVPTAVLFDWETGKRLRILKPQNTADGSCWGVRFSPSGDFIVGAGGRGSGSLWFWKPNDEKSFFDLRLPNVPYDLQFHPDGLRLLLPFYDATIRVYDLGPKMDAAAKKEVEKAKGTEGTKAAKVGAAKS